MVLDTSKGLGLSLGLVQAEVIVTGFPLLPDKSEGPASKSRAIRLGDVLVSVNNQAVASLEDVSLAYKQADSPILVVGFKRVEEGEKKEEGRREEGEKKEEGRREEVEKKEEGRREEVEKKEEGRREEGDKKSSLGEDDSYMSSKDSLDMQFRLRRSSLTVGQAVEVVNLQDEWVSARVWKANENGSLDLVFGSGEKAFDVARSNVRRFFSPGAKVTVAYAEPYKAIIQSLNPDGTYTVRREEEAEGVDSPGSTLTTDASKIERVPRNWLYERGQELDLSSALQFEVSLSLDSEGDFGVKLGWTSSGFVIVTGFKPNGHAERSNKVRVKDVLLAVNQEQVYGLTFAQVGLLVKSSGDQVTLKFATALETRKEGSGSSEESSGEE